MALEVRSVACVLLTLPLLVCAAPTPVVINFDNLDTTAGDLSLEGLGSYGDLTWSNTLAYGAVPGFDGFNNGIVSPVNAAYSGGDAGSPIVGSASRQGLFDLESAYVGAGFYDDLVVTFKGLRNGVVLFTKVVTVDTTGASLLNFGFTDIDTLLFEASVTTTTTDPFGCGGLGCTQFTLDDVSVVLKDEHVPTNGVPEPSTLLLALSALAGTTFRRRRA